MAVNPNHHEADLARDPRLARLLEAAGGDAPPVALDAAIVAAARREVGARPQVVGGGAAASAASIPIVRAKRNWTVPVSIAAVLVMSASLVMVVHDEKRDEVAQSPRQASTPAKPAVPPLPSAAPAPAAEVSGPPLSDKPAELLRDASPAQPTLAEKTVVVRQDAPASLSGATTGPRKTQRVEKAEATPDSARKDKVAAAVVREPEVTGSIGTSAPAAPAAVPPPVEAKPAAEPFPAQAGRAAMARARSEADQVGEARDAAQAMPSNAPPAAAASAARRAAPAAENRAVAAAPPPAPIVAAKPMAPLAKSMARTPVWHGLEEQPAEKWLERVAEFKRDGRVAEVDELMSEFRRRFPDHPASVR